MFNGLSREKADQLLKPCAPALIEFVEAVQMDREGQDDGEPPRRGGVIGVLV